MECSKTLNFTNLSKELKLQVELLKLDSLINLNIDLFTKIDWNEFIALTIHHRTFCTLYKKVKHLNGKYIPDFAIHKLEMLYKKNIYKMLHLSTEMEKVNKLMIKEDIKFLLLKGPALAKELYGDISLRTSCDIDFLVPIEELERIDTLLQNEGYVKNDYFRSILNDWKWRNHHVTYFHPSKEVKLEVHWRLNPGPASEPSFNELWERRKISKLTSTPLYLLGNEDLFLFLASHGARHGWSRLRWLLDINQIMKKDNINIEKLKKVAEKHNYTHLLGQSIRLTSELFDTQIIKNLLPFNNNKRVTSLARLAIFYLERKVNLHTYPVPKDISQYHKNYLFSIKSPIQKLFFVMSFFYPYPEDQDILPLPKRLHFLYFPLRPFIWLWNKAARIRSQVIQ
ncbi:nucleotidyltransferase family protein [Fictibacillus halophilus]|uniref:nucleotidyltransferase domain-containing protein n=1 Tax=Fictibacillus halophilus TaxID=1610490 RepID=UPI003626C158